LKQLWSEFNLKKVDKTDFENNLFIKMFKQNDATFCNFNRFDYEQGKFNIVADNIDSKLIGVKKGERIIMGVATHDWNFNSSNYMDNVWKQNLASFCLYNIKQLVPTAIFSLMGRDTAQFLHHLTQYEIEQSSSDEKLNKMVNFGRHQLFTRPIRLAIESKKATKEQLQDLLKLNVPIFHVESLGHLVGTRLFGDKASNQKESFIFDSRYFWNNVCK
jgi:hypothetical protein